MNSLPVPQTHPAETLAISPEGLEIANCYLVHQNVLKVSEELSVSPELVVDFLDREDVKLYIGGVFRDLGFNNRFKMRRAMDVLISKKFQELEESGMGSTKDIADLLALSHKMTMEELDREIALEKVKSKNSTIKSQVNVQINDHGSNYGNLLEKLMNVKN